MAYMTRTPLECVIEIISRCQLECKYCYSKKNNDCIDVSDLSSILPQLKKIGVIKISLTGGEPLLHKDILKMLDIIASYDFIVEIQTNGLLLTKEMIQHIKVLGNTNLQISYHSDQEEIFDEFVGVKGVFKKLETNIKMLMDENQHFTLVFNVTSINQDSAKEIIENFEKMSIEYILNYDVYPFNENRSQDMVCSNNDVLKYIMTKKYPISGYDFFKNNSCGATKIKFRITSNGDLQICPLINGKYGNIRDDSIEYFWNKIGCDNRIQEALFGKRDDCKDCLDYDICSKCNAYCISGEWETMKQSFCVNTAVIKYVIDGGKDG